MFAGSLTIRSLSKNRQLAICFLAGAWCLASFVLVTAYSSVLIACITAPDKFKPIINSVNDLPNKPDIRVTVNKDFILDVIFKVIVRSIDRMSSFYFDFYNYFYYYKLFF